MPLHIQWYLECRGICYHPSNAKQPSGSLSPLSAVKILGAEHNPNGVPYLHTTFLQITYRGDGDHEGAPVQYSMRSLGLA